MNPVVIMAALGGPVLIVALWITLLDLIRDSPWVLYALIALLVALGVAFHLGVLGPVWGWMAGHETVLLAGLAVLAGLLYPAARLRAYWRFRTLRWPPTLAPETFQERCARFLGRQGWLVESGIERHGFRATKGDAVLQVQCVSVPVTPLVLSAIRRTGETIVVSYLPLPTDVIYQAHRQGLRLIHYRQLGVLDDVLVEPLDAEPPAAWGVLRGPGGETRSTAAGRC
jgi:hypothetical protein